MSDTVYAGKGNRRGGRAKAVLFAVAVALVAAVLATALVACKPKNPPSADQITREEAISAFVTNAVEAAGEGWRTEMTYSEIADLRSPATYIVTSAWIKRTGSLLNGLSVSTSKIRTLADYMNTDEARTLLRSPSFDFEKFIDAFSGVGFTSADTQEIVFALLVELSDGTAVFTDVRDALVEVNKRVSDKQKVTEIESALTAVNALLSTYADNGGLRDSIAAAKAGICALVDMAYQGMYMFGSGDAGEGLFAIIDAMNAGALTDISNADAHTYLTAFLAQAAALRDKFTAEEVALLSDTLGALDDAFGRLALPASLKVGGMLGYFGEMKFAADWMHYALDTVYEAGTLLLNEKDGQGNYTYRFVDRLFDYVGSNEGLADSKTGKYNSYILYAELLLAAEKTGALGEALSAQLERYASETDIDNLINLFAVSGVVDIWTYTGQFEDFSDIIADEQYRALSISVAGLYLNAFKNAYAQGLSTGDYSKIAKRFDNLSNYVSKICDEFGIGKSSWIGSSAPSEVTGEWYNTVVKESERVINSAADSVTSDSATDYRTVAVERIEAALKDFLGREQVRAALEGLAAAEFADRDMTSAELDEWTRGIEAYINALLPSWIENVGDGSNA